MKRYLVITLIAFCCFGSAQQPSKIIVWEQDSPHCKLIYENGIPHQQYISDSQFLIEVYPPAKGEKRADMVRVVVYNGKEAKGDLDVDPATFGAILDDAHRTLIPSADADKVLASGQKSSSRMNIIGAALQGFGAGMQTHTATVTNTNGTSSTVTYHDPADDRTARNNATTAAAANARLYSAASASVLRRNTVTPGNSVEGVVYFVRPKQVEKKADLRSLGLSIGGVIYVFPFKGR